MIKPDLIELKNIVELKLAQSLRGEFFSKDLQEAIAYALLGPGKRLRPLMVLANALAYAEMPSQKALSYALPAALAVEYVHTYSLIHDDLPAMDNDDYRRGRPSLHRRFNEALAILAGDALLSDAFGHLAKARINAAHLCYELSLSAGRLNLVGGQAEDLAGQKAKLGDEQWLLINTKKTARLFEACAVMGALSVDAPKAALEQSRRFGHHFGVAFQLKDDLDDMAFMAQSPRVRELLQDHLKAAFDQTWECKAPGFLQDIVKLVFKLEI